MCGLVNMHSVLKPSVPYNQALVGSLHPRAAAVPSYDASCSYDEDCPGDQKCCHLKIGRHRIAMICRSNNIA